MITDALLADGHGGYVLHPSLDTWRKSLASCQQTWFVTEKKNPLAMYAAVLGVAPARILADKLDVSGAQYWVASPYHGQLARDSVRVLPEYMLSWHAQDAHWVCDALNPLLEEDGMRLHSVGSALLLVCEQALQVSPKPFSKVAGHDLPNQHPEGVDGGKLMRLLAEIQMQLRQTPCTHRNTDEHDIHGLWFWGESTSDADSIHPIAIATRNAYLQSVVDSKDARIMITESEHVSELIHNRAKLPKDVLLMGDEHSVLLKKSWIPHISQPVWQVKSTQSESILLEKLSMQLTKK